MGVHSHIQAHCNNNNKYRHNTRPFLALFLLKLKRERKAIINIEHFSIVEQFSIVVVIIIFFSSRVNVIEQL